MADVDIPLAGEPSLGEQIPRITIQELDLRPRLLPVQVCQLLHGRPHGDTAVDGEGSIAACAATHETANCQTGNKYNPHEIHHRLHLAL